MIQILQKIKQEKKLVIELLKFRTATADGSFVLAHNIQRVSVLLWSSGGYSADTPWKRLSYVRQPGGP